MPDKGGSMVRFSLRRLVGFSTASVMLLALALISAACGSSGPSSSSTAAASPSPSSTTVIGLTISSEPSLHALLPQSVISANVVRVATTLPCPPWEYYTDSSHTTLTGFEADILQALGAKLNIPFKMINMQWDSVVLSVQGGKSDMIMGDMFDNLDREKTLTFVDYTYDGGAILVAKGNPQGITSLDSLSGKAIAVLSGSTEQPFLENLNKKFTAAGKTPMKIMVLPSPSDLLAVQSGRVAADCLDRSTAEAVARTTNNGNTFEVIPPDPAYPKGFEPAIVGTAILKSNTQLVSAIQKGLQALIDDGTYAKLIDKYGLIGVKSAILNGASTAAAAQ
jgi:polar amino acid transport system substrate-binding protein